jgi:hypothetical protein
MSNWLFDLESFWDSMLSRDPQRIRNVYFSLSPEGKISVIAHLNRMSSEIGWQPEQRVSAQSALDAIQNL